MKPHLHDAYLRDRDRLRPVLEESIERNRKQDFIVSVVDANGVPRTGVKVEAVQKRHQFDFGCNCLWLGQKGADESAYEKLITDLFNFVTTTFCLGDIQYEPGKWRFEDGVKEIFRRPPPDRVVKFAHAHNLKLKGQPLMAGSWYPEWAKAKNLSDEEIHQLYLQYFKRVSQRYGETFAIFDLVNEANCHTHFQLYNPELDFVTWVFRNGKPLFSPAVKLELNEATQFVFPQPADSGKNEFYNLVRKVINEGAAPDSIGMQFHLWEALQELIRGEGAYVLSEIQKRLMEFSRFGLPLYISEITIPSVIEETRCEEIQAEVAEDFYRLFFSIPQMNGVIYWNLCDGAAWKKEGACRGGLADEYLRPKPIYHRLEHLIQREWNTAVFGTTGEQGTFAFRGFKGGYEFTVTLSDGTSKRISPVNNACASEVTIQL